LIDYFKAWRPAYPAGTQRTYSNPGIGMLGMIAAISMQESFDDAIEKKLFRGPGMTNSYINVPPGQMKHYAQGYTKECASPDESRGSCVRSLRGEILHHRHDRIY
jgi:beta-lactamase class C